MTASANHLTSEALQQGLAEVILSPKDNGPLEAIFVRPQVDERQTLTTAKLSTEGGIDGDSWKTDHWKLLPDGQPDPQSQVSLMNSRILRLISGGEEAMSLSGDNLIVDLDLSEENFPVGSRLQIGNKVVLEFTEQPHTGCGKFSVRYGAAALEFINGPQGQPLNLRGRYAQIVSGGTIQVGDSAKKN